MATTLLTRVAAFLAQLLILHVITTPDAPAAIGPYSQATGGNGLVFLSGQIGMDPASGNLVSDDVTEQAEQALKNLSAVVKASGSSMDRVLKTTVLLQDMNDYAAVNTVYAKYFGANPPARAAFAVAGLPKGAKLEIEGIALASDEAATAETLAAAVTLLRGAQAQQA
eukprot:GFYU01000644.1.p1 GENE.GFYU01000644.1~~GFYU01000644.1.p1  ORF type:complete len:168 (+),score=59.92 GFYU01000644.1:120-623(+)